MCSVINLKLSLYFNQFLPFYFAVMFDVCFEYDLVMKLRKGNVILLLLLLLLYYF